MKHTLLDIEKGMVVQLQGAECTAQFLGFTGTDSKSDKREGVKYANMGELVNGELGEWSEADIEGALKALEDAGSVPQEGHPHGNTIYALFKDIDTGDVWGAYLYEGEWCYKSGAEIIYPVRKVQDEPYFTDEVMDSPAYALELALADLREARGGCYSYRVAQLDKVLVAFKAFEGSLKFTSTDTDKVIASVGFDVYAADKPRPEDK